ncbi:Ubiquitin-like domain-containing protein [Psidium guajava]|nr:Ubiquitin-like domain-containing protein [Psidium guajava]
MKVVVEILTGALFSADVPGEGTVADLKQEIGAQQKLPRDRLILLLCGGDRSDPIKDDEDGARLVDVGIRDGSHVYLFFKLVDPDDSEQPPPPVVAVDGSDASPEDQTVVHST